MTGLERFERIAIAYLHAGEEQRTAALALMPEEEREQFLRGVGLYHLFTDPIFYRDILDIACRLYGEEFEAAKENPVW